VRANCQLGLRLFFLRFGKEVSFLAAALPFPFSFSFVVAEMVVTLGLGALRCSPQPQFVTAKQT
jgi:hypothetical protein